MFVLIPIASFPLVTGRDLVYAIRSMRSGEDKTINGIGSRPKRPVCACRLRWEDPTATKNKDLAQFILISTGLLVEHSSYF